MNERLPVYFQQQQQQTTNNTDQIMKYINTINKLYITRTNHSFAKNALDKISFTPKVKLQHTS